MTSQSGGPALLDLNHLREQTAGDDELGRELLVLFERQCASLLPLVSTGSPGAQAAASHSLKGAALAVGAFAVAAAADAIEADVGLAASKPAPLALVQRLREAVEALLAELARQTPSLVPQPAESF